MFTQMKLTQDLKIVVFAEMSFVVDVWYDTLIV